MKRVNEIPTIDVNLVTITTTTGGDTPVVTEIGIETANKIEVTPSIETADAVKLIVKGVLKAQKPAVNTLTGHAIVLTDNTFGPELVKVLQGGTITYDTEDTSLVRKYVPPVAGSSDKGEVFTLNAYSAVYNVAGLIDRYEKIKYPNCQGVPISMSSEDGVFRVSSYTINSAPDDGEAPYEIEYVDALPVFT